MTPPHVPILLVEDSPFDVDLTLRAFERQQVANPVIVLRDGEELLDWMAHHGAGEAAPAVILLDLHLPRVDGLTVLKALKTHPGLQRVPVVVLTTSNEERDIHAAYDLGANSYIVKPVDFDNFLDVARLIKLYWCMTNVRARW